jgi:hypothetical protein
MRRVHRDSRVIGWDLVDDVAPGAIRLKTTAS